MFRPSHVGFAQLDRGRIVYLDTRADRYGCLSPALARALFDGGEQRSSATASAERLVAQGLLSRDQGGTIWPAMPNPIGSALEEDGDMASLSWPLFPRLMAVIWGLRRNGLHNMLERLRRDRSHIGPDPSLGLAGAIARTFDRRRARIPITRICLPDGLLLSRILLDHGITSRLIFGVRLDPFAAHCWVEKNGLILSDGADHAREFTPVYCA